MVADPTADLAGDRFTVELVADGNDPAEGPAAVRLKRWLKAARRSHGLTAVAVAPVAEVPTGHLAVTNAPANRWRPNGRAIRRAAAGPLGHVCRSEPARPTTCRRSFAESGPAIFARTSPAPTDQPAGPASTLRANPAVTPAPVHQSRPSAGRSAP